MIIRTIDPFVAYCMHICIHVQFYWGGFVTPNIYWGVWAQKTLLCVYREIVDSVRINNKAIDFNHNNAFFKPGLQFLFLYFGLVALEGSTFPVSEGVLMIDYLQTIDGTYYVSNLKILKETIKTKRQRKLRAGVLFSRTMLHSTAQHKWQSQKRKIRLSTPDFAQSDY